MDLAVKANAMSRADDELLLPENGSRRRTSQTLVGSKEEVFQVDVSLRPARQDVVVRS